MTVKIGNLRVKASKVDANGKRVSAKESFRKKVQEQYIKRTPGLFPWNRAFADRSYTGDFNILLSMFRDHSQQYFFDNKLTLQVRLVPIPDTNYDKRKFKGLNPFNIDSFYLTIINGTFFLVSNDEKFLRLPLGESGSMDEVHDLSFFDATMLGVMLDKFSYEVPVDSVTPVVKSAIGVYSLSSSANSSQLILDAEEIVSRNIMNIRFNHSRQQSPLWEITEKGKDNKPYIKKREEGRFPWEEATS